MVSSDDQLDIAKIYDEVIEKSPSLALGLTHNPFPPTGITGSGSAPGPYYLLPGVQENLSEFVRQAVRNVDFCGMVVLGDYGSGKTALLKYFERAVSRSQERGLPLAAYYVANPGINFADVLQSMTRAIDRDVLQKYAWAFAVMEIQSGQQENGEYMEDLGLPAISPEQLLQITDRHQFWRVFREELGVSANSISEAVTNVLQQALPDSALAQDLSALMLGDRRTASQTWANLTRQLPATSSKKPEPSNRLDSLMTILSKNGINHVFLLIDEFEDVVFNRMSKRQRDDFTATLRLLIAQHGHDLSVIFASNSAGWELITRSDPGLQERFKFELELGEFNGDDLKGVVTSYLRNAKIEDVDTAFEVYSDQTLSFIQEHQYTLARPLMAVLYRLTENFWDAEQSPSVAEIESFLTEPYVLQP